ncbi:MAG: Flp pilus assembly protein CpaB [Zetaproteobacteria bacterium]|nr:MAG: Flp pilus assembly protein CpaB [Zetaproteobacteria bacterium]
MHNITSPEMGSKKMNKNILIVLGGAILAAVLVAVLVQVTLGGKKGPVAVSENSVEILVAAKDLRKGHELEDEDMRWKSWDEDALFRGAIIREDDMEAKDALSGRLDRSFGSGEALVKRAILKDSKGNYVVARLKEGERAISIKVSAEDMVAGFIAPGNFVDVILTYTHRKSVSKDELPQIRDMVAMSINKLAVETVLENVRVLAIDQKAQMKKDDKIKTGKTVTLAVSIRSAEILALASEMGSLTLAMRGIGDDLVNKDEATLTDARLTTIDDEIRAETIRLKKETGVNLNTVKVYNGAQVQTFPVH